MKWSYSSSIQFLSCERKWYYANKFASFNCNTEARKNAAFLKDGQTLDEWKGTVVDTVISKFVHRETKYEKNPSLEDYIIEAKNISRTQFEFAKNRRWEQIESKTSVNGEYAILSPFLFSEEIKEDEKLRVWNEMKLALKKYFDDVELMEEMKEASHVFTQYPLRIKEQNVSLEGKPDLLLFFDKKPPKIIDWKVYRDSTFSHKQQLLIYAYMLHKILPQEKFPNSYKEFDILDYRVCEYQLLTGKVRNYVISEQDVQDTEEFINETVYKMKRKNCHYSPKKLGPDDFRMATNPDTCKKCNFQSICWH